MNRYLLAGSILLLASSKAFPIPDCSQTFCLVIGLEGQSNMTGHGSGPSYVPQYGSQIWKYTQGYDPSKQAGGHGWCRAVNVDNPSGGNIVPATEPLHNEPPTSQTLCCPPAPQACDFTYQGAGNGMGVALADTIIAQYRANNPSVGATMQVLLVPSGQGGTSTWFYGWEPTFQGTSSAYGPAVGRLVAAMMAVHAPRSAAMVVWYQGDTDGIVNYQSGPAGDCNSPGFQYTNPDGSPKEPYGAAYPYFWTRGVYDAITGIRNRIGNPYMPVAIFRNFNFWAGTICGDRFKYIQDYASQMAGRNDLIEWPPGSPPFLPSTDPQMVVIDAADMSNNPDTNAPDHFGTQSLITMGQRAALGLCSITGCR